MTFENKIRLRYLEILHILEEEEQKKKEEKRKAVLRIMAINILIGYLKGPVRKYVEKREIDDFEDFKDDFCLSYCGNISYFMKNKQEQKYLLKYVKHLKKIGITNLEKKVKEIYSFVHMGLMMKRLVPNLPDAKKYQLKEKPKKPKPKKNIVNLKKEWKDDMDNKKINRIIRGKAGFASEKQSKKDILIVEEEEKGKDKLNMNDLMRLQSGRTTPEIEKKLENQKKYREMTDDELREEYNKRNRR
ncbi:MAG: hypothetical protein ACFFDF_03880 [Candidatus Odinarchaeota archaeon]